MAKGMLVVKNVGQIIPDQFMGKILAAYPAGAGLAVVEDAKATSIILSASTKTQTVDKLRAAQGAYKDRAMLMFFGENDGKPLTKESLQPFTFLWNEKNEPTLVGVLAGDFANYENKESGHSTAYHAFYDYLGPKIKKIDAAYKDWDKFTAELKDPLFIKDCLNTYLGSGAIVLMDYKGEFFAYTKDEIHKMPWGWASDMLDYSEGEYPAKAEVKKKPVLLDEDDMPPAKVEPEPEKKVEAAPATPVVQPEVKVEPPKTDTAIQAGLNVNSDYVNLACPATITHNKSVREWYRMVTGSVPEKWKKRPAVPVLKSKVIDLGLKGHLKNVQLPQEILEAIAGKPSATSDNVVKLDQKPKEDVQQTIAKNHERIEAAKAEKKDTVREFVPIISAESRDKIKEEFLKAHGFNSVELPVDPAFISTLETKLPSFCKTVGLDGLEQTFRWSAKAISELVHKFPDAATKLLLDYRYAYVKTLEKEEQEQAKAKQKEETAAKKRKHALIDDDDMPPMRAAM